MSNVANTRQIRFVRRTSSYWRVTFDNPPLNIFGPETIPELNEIVTALETDEDVKVVVFDSVVEGFFLTHYNFLAKLEDTTSLLPGPTGLSPLPEFMATSIALSAKNESQLSRRPGDNGSASRLRRKSNTPPTLDPCTLVFARRTHGVNRWHRPLVLLTPIAAIRLASFLKR